MNKFIIVLILSLQAISVIGQINMTQYWMMPPLYSLEDYDQCIQNSHTYCMVYAEIVPDDQSDLWHLIYSFSANWRKHFRHDKLFFGVCLEKCKDMLKELDDSSVESLYMEPVKDKEIESHYNAVHPYASDERRQYERIIDSCLNYEFRQKYNLSLRSLIEYCESGETEPEESGILISLTWVIFAILIFLNLFSTAFDYRLKKLNLGDATLRKETTSLKWFTAFSLPRSWQHLTRLPKSPLEEDLRFLEAYRTFTIFLVILVHCMLVVMAMPLMNPDFIENLHYQASSGILRNGSVAIQIFFVISSFLLYVHFNDRKMVTETTNVLNCIGVYTKLIVYRIVRLIPSVMLLILVQASILYKLQDGPFWRHISAAEVTFCRKYWWKNLFFLSSLLMKESCAEQTWYLGTDMHLFVLFLFVIIVFSKYPKLKYPLLGLTFIASVAIPAIITYVKQLDPVHISHPEFYRYRFFKNAKTFYASYAPFYTNISGYLFGVICADIYLYKLRGRKLTIKWLWNAAFLMLAPIAFGLLILSTLFVESGPNLWASALYAGLYRIIWMPVCIFTIWGMCCKVGWVAYELSCLPIFRIFGRLSYQAFLWHAVVIFVLIGYVRKPVYLNHIYLICFVLTSFVLSNVIALVMTLTFEIPITNMISILRQKNTNESKQKTKEEKLQFENVG